MRGIGTGRPSAGGRIAAALCALLALGGATAALADEAIIADQEGIEAIGGAAAGQEGAGSVAVQADRLGPQASNVDVTASDTAWTDGNTYTVKSNVTITERITCAGNVTLVLSENTKLTAEKGITVAEGNTLTIKGSGELVAGGGTTPDYYAGIGGGVDKDAGTVNITGGTVTATGGTGAAGIGGASGGRGGTVTIGGDADVTATGGESGAGIGNGDGAAGMTATITGGAHVTAMGGKSADGIGAGGGYGYGNSGTITIESGTVTATGGQYGAGIGGGNNGVGGTVTIEGGTVTAKGGDRGAGIGGHEDCPGGTTNIKGGTVTATGGDCAAGIGGGEYGSGGTVTIAGGVVTATGGAAGAGIGGGIRGSGGTVSISGGTVTAVGRTYADTNYSRVYAGAGIGSGGYGNASFYGDPLSSGKVTISGGTVTATGGGIKQDFGQAAGAGIGGGSGVSDGTVKLSGGKVTATGGKASDDIVAQGIGYGALKDKDGVRSTGEGSVTLALGAGVVLKGGTTENPTTVLATGAVESYDKDRYQYMDAAATVTVTFDANGRGTAPAAQTVELGGKATEPDKPTADGYEFGGWYADKDCTNAYDFTAAVEADVTLYAKWTETPTPDPTPTPTPAPGKEAVTLKFRKAKVTKAYGAKAFTNKLTNESGVIATYESSNKKVAKVNKTTGKVTLKGLGTATITATFAGDATHEAATASYKLVVKLAKTQGLKTVCHPGERTVDVSWGKVKGAKRYQVQWRLRGGRWRTRATEGTELTLEGMKDKGYYEIRVRAVSGMRRGAWSTVSRRWYVRAAGVSAKATSKGRVEVSWSKTKGANRGYLVLVRYSEDGPVVAKKTVGKGKTSATISGLRSGKSAWVSVRPLCRAYGRTWVGVLTPIAGVRIG